MHAESPDFSLRDLLEFARRSIAAVVVAVVVGAVISAAVAFFTKPVYRATVLLAPESSDSGTASALGRIMSQLGPAASLLGGVETDVGGLSRDVRIATLRSRRLTEEFVRAHELSKVFFPEQWSLATDTWKTDDGRSLEPSMDDVVLFFDDEVRRVGEDRRTGLVTVSIEWSDPVLAAEWANDLVARANEFLRQRAIDQARRSMAFLEEELVKTSIVERQQIIYRLIESKTSEVMLANSRTEYAFQIVDAAVSPSPNNYVRPRRGLYILVGGFLGLLAGATYGGLSWAMRRNAAVGAT